MGHPIVCADVQFPKITVNYGCATNYGLIVVLPAFADPAELVPILLVLSCPKVGFVRDYWAIVGSVPISALPALQLYVNFVWVQ